MKTVLLCGAFWHGSLEESYARAFESIGWNVIRFDWERHSNSQPLANISIANKLLKSRIAGAVGKQFVHTIAEARPDLVFVIKGKTVSPEILSEVKRTMGDRPLINFNPDSPWDAANYSAWLVESIPEYDAHFTWNSLLMPRFANAGAKHIYHLPFAYDPLLHHPLLENTIPKHDAIFVGTYSSERDEILGSLQACDIRIVGNGWSKAKHVPKEWILSEAVYGDEAVSVLNVGACAINLLRPQNAGSHNMRTFEIPATARPMLSTRSEEQSQFFIEGSEMECFSNPGELQDKIRFLASNLPHAESIAKNGYERVREETYAKRAGTIEATLGFANS